MLSDHQSIRVVIVDVFQLFGSGRSASRTPQQQDEDAQCFPHKHTDCSLAQGESMTLWYIGPPDFWNPMDSEQRKIFMSIEYQLSENKPTRDPRYFNHNL